MMTKFLRLTVVALLFATVSCRQGAQSAPAVEGAETRVDVVFSGGHETDPGDGGRPVVLIANALGVPPQVFRDVFRGVRPAGPGRGPCEQEARQNKDVLLAGLRRYGVTNERLDEVSNYYRYNRSRGEMWRNKAASAYAVLEKGKVIKFVITDGGSGYASAPSVTVPGVEEGAGEVTLSYGKAFENNGSVTAIAVPATAVPATKEKAPSTDTRK